MKDCYGLFRGRIKMLVAFLLRDKSGPPGEVNVGGGEGGPALDASGGEVCLRGSCCKDLGGGASSDAVGRGLESGVGREAGFDTVLVTIFLEAGGL